MTTPTQSVTCDCGCNVTVSVKTVPHVDVNVHKPTITFSSACGRGPTGPQGEKGDTGPAGGGTQQGQWIWVAAAVSAPVAAGQVGVDNDAVSLATHLWIDSIGVFSGVDWSTQIKELQDGDHLYIQKKDDASMFLFYRVTGPAVANTTSWVIPVQYVDASLTEFVDLTDVAVAFQWDSRYVAVTGDTMTGPLVLYGPPTADLQAATRKFVSDHHRTYADLKRQP